MSKEKNRLKEQGITPELAKEFVAASRKRRNFIFVKSIKVISGRY